MRVNRLKATAAVLAGAILVGFAAERLYDSGLLSWLLGAVAGSMIGPLLLLRRSVRRTAWLAGVGAAIVVWPAAFLLGLAGSYLEPHGGGPPTRDDLRRLTEAATVLSLIAFCYLGALGGMLGWLWIGARRLRGRSAD